MMTALRLADIAADTGGQLSADANFEKVCTDTRQLQRGDLYVALQGEHFNGNRLVDKAQQAGAVAAVVSEPCEVEMPHLQVEDSRLALGLIARRNRRQFKGPVIALTGSAGKTSTKQMLAAILSVRAEVLATQGNLNNEIGVPLTLLELSPQHDCAVIEMGACRQGDIAYLTRFAEPQVSILTNAMPVHIESFRDIDTVARTKGEIFECLPADGHAIINFDDRYFSQWCAQASTKQIISFSLSDSQANIYASNIDVSDIGKTRFSLHHHQQSVDIAMPLLGKHNVGNALAAAAAALAVGVDLAQIKAGLEQAANVGGRLRRIQCGDKTLIDDSYNAHPESVKAAIDVLQNLPGSHTLIVGTMAELGELATEGHRQVAAYAKQQGVEQLIAVGEYSELMVTEFAGSCTSGNGMAFSTVDELLISLDKLQGDCILVKASRCMKLERVVEKLVGRAEQNSQSNNKRSTS